MHSGGGGINWEGKNPNEGIEFAGFYVDYNLVEMLNLELTDGQSFSSGVVTDRDKVIFNETAIAMMKLKDPIGKVVTMWGKERQIIGIVKNFHYESLYKEIGPLFIACQENNFSTLIKIKAGKEQETLEQISKVYSDFNFGLPLEYQFLDQDFEELYAAENRVSILSGVFAGIAILISCLGLFGLAAFTAERKTKEIGIRKVLGSNEWSIVLLLSKSFTRMVLIAVMIGLPLSFLISRQWLMHFAYRIDLKWWFFAGAGFIALFISWFTIVFQTIKAAKVNPTNCLRTE
jgi:putative ABC transport system permease protein